MRSMVDRRRPPESLRNAVLEAIDRDGLSALARHVGLNRATLSRVADGKAVTPRTLEALKRLAPRVRTAAEFTGAQAASPPPDREGAFAWSLESIRGARDDQMLGNFASPVKLAESLRTDAALFNAYHTRIAPQSSVRTKLTPADGARGENVARKAMSSVFVPRSVLAGIQGTLANHGVAVAFNRRQPTDDGTRIDFHVEEWPLEHVRWNATRRTLETTTDDFKIVPITHGDGTWTIFRKFHRKPWTQDACILPGAIVWAARANGLRDWAATTRAHGLAKMIGELPEGLALVDEDGKLSPEAAAFLDMMIKLVSGESPTGIRPAGSKTDFVANGSNPWQIFKELIDNGDKWAARIYLGVDAVLGSVGGAPGVDISALFALSTTKVQTDLGAIEAGLRTGVYEPWCAVNEGTSQYAPWFRYDLPDPDAQQRAEQQHAKRVKLVELIAAYKAQGFIVDQDVVNRIAAELGVEDPPTLAPAANQSVPIDLAPTDKAKAVRIVEVRRSMGLEPLGDARDLLTFAELDARRATPPPAAAPAPAPVEAPPA